MSKINQRYNKERGEALQALKERPNIPATEDRLRVWWIPQVPGMPFRVGVPDIRTARILLDALADYDMFQLAHNIKPDYSNAGGLEVCKGGEWEDWYDDDQNDIEAYDTNGELNPS